MVVVINGTTATGKTVLAGHLASALQWPLLSKDRFKEALWDALPRPQEVDPVAWSRRLGAAAYDLLWALLTDTGPHCIVEGPMSLAFAAPALARARARAVEIFLWADPQVVHERFLRRHEAAHACHRVLGLPTLDMLRAGLDSHAPLALGPTLRVDTSAGLDLDQVLSWLELEGVTAVHGNAKRD